MSTLVASNILPVSNRGSSLHLDRAFIAFNGITTTTILGSFNVASIVDEGTGITKVNFSQMMPHNTYGVIQANQRLPTVTVVANAVSGVAVAHMYVSSAKIYTQTANTNAYMDVAHSCSAFSY